MAIDMTEEELNDDLPIPILLAGMIASGEWRHPGGDILRKITPFIEEIEFLHDVERIMKESAALQKGGMGAMRSTNPRNQELPFLDGDLALLIAVNREHGDDVAIALDYRTSMTDPRVVASAMSPDKAWIWREVAPSFSEFIGLINAAVAKQEADAELANTVPGGPLTIKEAMLSILFGVVLYLIDCHFQYARHPDLSWIQSGMYSGGFLIDIIPIGLGIYGLAKPAE